MARSPSPHTSTCPAQVRLPLLRGAPNQARKDLLGMIRNLVLREQRQTPQAFISLRTAATRFDAPLPEIAAIYKQLTGEGLLGGIRGSHTIIVGSGRGRDLRVRGVVGIPVSLTRFRSLGDYGRCVIELRDELRRRGFAVRTIFSGEAEGGDERLLARLKKEKVDTVLRLIPDAMERDTPLRLRDSGIEFTGLNLAPLCGKLARYQVDRQPALKTILQDWKQHHAITAIRIIQMPCEPAIDRARLRNLLNFARTIHRDCQIVTLEDGIPLGAALASTCGEGTGLLLPALTGAILGWRTPGAIVSVLKMCRIALIDGPLESPFLETISPRVVDLIRVDWKMVAKRLAQDMVTGREPGEISTVFEAEACLRPLAVCQQ